MKSEEVLVLPHRQEGMRELLSLLLPIFTILFAACGVGFLERIFLSRYSLEALEGSIQAIYILQVFQFPLINFANMTQVFIGTHLGSEEPHQVGPSVWQMGWISLLSMILVIPAGILASSFFFKGTVVETPSMTYFNTLLSVNFLFPLGAALTSFYLVQKRIRFIIGSTLIAYGLTLVLDLAFIFGIPHLCPPLGVLGASLSQAIGRLVFCGILLKHFLKRPYLEQYRTDRWKIDLSKLWHYLRVCSPRAGGRVLTLLTWAFTSHFMVIKGGDHLLILSIGGTLTLFCVFFTDSLIQSLTLIFSRYLGSQQYQKIWKSWRAGLLLVIALYTVLSIPFLIFPDSILSFFFAELPPDPLRECLHWTLYWVFGWVFFYALSGLFLPFLLAMRDTVFYMTVMFLNLITSALPVYFCITKLNWTPDKFWMIMLIEQSIVLGLYTWRVYGLYQVQLKTADMIQLD